MKASLFCTARYMGAAPHDMWPLSGEYYSGDAAVRSMETAFDQFRCADEFGFDWVTVAKYHYSGFSLTPNPMVMAGALSQLVRRAKIAVLGPTLPILNPVRVAEEFAMLDTMSGGRLIAGMMRGTPNEYVTYKINPAELPERFAEALQRRRAPHACPCAVGRAPTRHRVRDDGAGRDAAGGSATDRRRGGGAGHRAL